MNAQNAVSKSIVPKAMPQKKRTKSSSILLESTRQFCEIKRPSLEDISAYKAFFYQFIDTLPDTDKRQVAAILARNPFTPRPIGLYLAMDKIDVAAPFLLFSPILKELDLNAISRKMGETYAQVINRRDEGNKILGVNEANLESSTGVLNDRVSFNAATASKDVAKDDVILKIDPSDNAALITRPLTEAIKKSTLEEVEEISLISVEPKNAKLKTPMGATGKVDTNEEAKEETKSNVSTSFKYREIEYISAVNSGTNESKDAWLSSEEIVALASVGGKLGKKKDPVVKNENIKSRTSLKATTNDKLLNRIEIATLIKQARAVDHKGFSQTVSGICGLSNEFVLNIINKKAGDQLLYLIKALDVPSPKDLQLLLMLAPKHGRGIDKYMEAKKQFAEMNVGICRMIFNEVGAKFEIPGAPSPVRIEGKRQDENFSHSVKMRRAHISAISRVDSDNQKQSAFGANAHSRKVS